MGKKYFCFFLLLLLFLPLFAAAEGLNLPTGLLNIEEETFAQDPSIQKVVIAEGTRTIGPGAFSGCTGLEEITLPASMKSIDETAFEDCGELSVVYVTPYTWACQWAMNRSYTVKVTGTETLLTPFTFDTALENVSAADSAEQIVLVSYQGGSSANLSVHEKKDGFYMRFFELLKNA